MSGWVKPQYLWYFASSTANICAQGLVCARKRTIFSVEFNGLEELCDARAVIPHIADIR